ncbi:MAG: glutamine amidotransferase [Microbacterium sp. SCN 70-200]|uniref:glutamine amidotransferase n=1 Tax=unclassified Microbacterium TaxID=2609290 RepID=UPI00086C497A|nr:MULTISPECIES: glutamine amidotransferase [unclassified Microbacterium]MBN9215980.1 glutamine amidotransferase [Microbacterium sp.]ODT41830.1 MAG: glutamine amidotransferase [Microbacterium sp. SCN 70-200]OJV84519.1 MAG: glutamine amidotransferase [Microbacterium sp. 70-16]
MKPFLLLATRAEDVPADEEYALFLRFTGLDERDLVRVRMEAGPLGGVDLDDYSGILVGGGPFNASDPIEKKSAVQQRVEAEISALLDEVVARDFPFFGACYGIGTVGAHQGAVIDGIHREPISVIEVRKTDAGRADPLLRELPDAFTAFVGHKEAISVLPPSATLLVRGDACPVQMFRVGHNVYATQFHPELDVDGISTRIRAYAGHGYFAADELDLTLAAVQRLPVVHTGAILRAFAQRYARP